MGRQGNIDKPDIPLLITLIMTQLVEINAKSLKNHS
jgi:hypothetical protein